MSVIATGPVYCDNCAAMIGRLETPFDWRGHIVCAKCFQKLAQTSEQDRVGSKNSLRGALILGGIFLAVGISLIILFFAQDADELQYLTGMFDLGCVFAGIGVIIFAWAAIAYAVAHGNRAS